MKSWLTYTLSLLMIPLLLAGSMSFSWCTMTCTKSGAVQAQLHGFELCCKNSLPTDEATISNQCCDFSHVLLELDYSFQPTTASLDVAPSSVPADLFAPVAPGFPMAVIPGQYADLPPPEIRTPSLASLQVFLI